MAEGMVIDVILSRQDNIINVNFWVCDSVADRSASWKNRI